MIDETVSLVDVSDATATLRIEDTDYPMRKLGLGDYAKAQQRLRDRWTNTVLDKLRTVPVDDAVVAKALAETVSRPITVMDVWNDLEGETYLLYLALQVNGKGPPLKYVSEEMPAVARRVLTEALLWACGMRAPDAETDRPLATTDTVRSSEVPVKPGTN